jgi:hypothetical protein
VCLDASKYILSGGFTNIKRELQEFVGTFNSLRFNILSPDSGAQAGMKIS